MGVAAKKGIIFHQNGYWYGAYFIINDDWNDIMIFKSNKLQNKLHSAKISLANPVFWPKIN